MNLCLAMTNLVGLSPFFEATGSDRFFVLLPLVSSFLFHLSETKHDLPGISPFKEYTHIFLMCDRISACVAVAWVISRFLDHHDVYIKNGTLSLGVVGFCSMLISETPGINQDVFFLLHNVWHICAFVVMRKIILNS
jgi:hypothetical protein